MAGRAWTLALVALLAATRTTVAARERRDATRFDATGADAQGLLQRVTRAHANCYENLPTAAAVLLYAIATGQTSITDPLALAFISARIAQSVGHIISVSRPFVLIRFGFYLVQVSILGFWIVRLAGLA
jgi:uncharacterized MAPEG superfamily protein